MEFLPGEGLLQHLASLQKLYIWGFDSLQCLPEEGLPPSVSFLKSTDVLPWRKVVRRKTYGRRLSQDISHSLHMDGQRANRMSTLSCCFLTFHSQLSNRSQEGHNGFSWRAFRMQASQICQSLPEEVG